MDEEDPKDEYSMDEEDTMMLTEGGVRSEGVRRGRRTRYMDTIKICYK